MRTGKAWEQEDNVKATSEAGGDKAVPKALFLSGNSADRQRKKEWAT